MSKITGKVCGAQGYQCRNTEQSRVYLLISRSLADSINSQHTVKALQFFENIAVTAY